MEVMMRQLFEIDLHDYENSDSVFSRPSVRGIIFKDDNKIALVYSENEKYYKFPGGGINKNEDKKEALIREVREEVGLIVIPESICEFGSVMRRQKSNVSPNTIFEQENFYYMCKTKNRIVDQDLDDYEAEAGFTLRFVSLDEAIRVNSAYKSEDYFNEIMIKRETKVLQMIKDTL
ncbi:MAG: NUDIX domain-containing protein [Clostridiales bacterium]|nr:NUDIX domain-containing protein [Clostridiales bacterium]